MEHYTIFAPMKSGKALEKMSTFMKVHFISPHDVLGRRQSVPYGHIENAIRGKRKLDLGFRVPTIMHPLEFELIKAMTMWMAAKSAPKRKIKGYTPSLKYYRDFEDKIKVIQQDIGWEVGYSRYPDKWPTSWVTGFTKKNLKLITDHIKYLDDLWELDEELGYSEENN